MNRVHPPPKCLEGRDLPQSMRFHVIQQTVDPRAAVLQEALNIHFQMGVTELSKQMNTRVV